MPQSNLSFEQRNLHGPVTSTPKNCIHQVPITYTGCHHVIIYSTHNSKRHDGYGFIGENGYIFHDSCCCIEVPIGGTYLKIYFMSLQHVPTPGSQVLSFSCSFQPKNRLAHPLWELAPPLRKILDPPLVKKA